MCWMGDVIGFLGVLIGDSLRSMYISRRWVAGIYIDDVPLSPPHLYEIHINY